MPNIGEINRTLKSAKRVVDYISQESKQVPPILALPIASKKTLNYKCQIDISNEKEKSCKLCKDLDTFYESNESDMIYHKLRNGVYTSDILAKISHKDYNLCPFHLVKKNFPDIVVCTHKAILNPKLKNYLLPNIPSNSVIIFDEAHNIGI